MEKKEYGKKGQIHDYIRIYVCQVRRKVVNCTVFGIREGVKNLFTEFVRKGRTKTLPEAQPIGFSQYIPSLK